MDKRPFVEVHGASSTYPLAEENTNPHPNERVLHMDVDPAEQQRLGSGAEGYIDRVIGRFGSKKRHELILAQKTMASPEQAFEQREIYLIAKAAGLPVPETFRPATHGLIMTDLTENGTAMVISANDMTAPGIDKLGYYFPKQMAHFKQSDMRAIEQQARDISSRARAAGLECSNEDSLFLIVKVGEPPRLMIADFGNIRKSAQPKEFETSTFIANLKDTHRTESSETEEPFWKRR